MICGEVPTTIDYATLLPAKYLRDTGFEVHLVVRGPQPRDMQIEGTTCWVESNTAAASRRVVSLRAELLFAESSAYAVLYGHAARRTWHRNPPLAHRPSARRLQRIGIRSFDAVSVTNPAHRDRWPLRSEQVVDFLYPVEIPFWRAPLAKNGEWWTSRHWTPPTGPVLVYVANLDPRKRQVELIGALAPLLRTIDGARLVLVGVPTDPSVETAVLRERQHQGIEDQVLLTGRLDHMNLRELMRWATLSVVHTAAETQCMALYESLAAGVAAVMSDIPELTSQFPFIPAHANDEQLRANVAALLTDEHARHRQVVEAQPVIAKADRAEHDAIFYATVERLLGRPVR